MRNARALPVLLASLAAACSAAQSSSDDLPEGGITTVGCPDFLDYDAGAIGSAGQVLPIVTAAANAWKPGLAMTGLFGRVSPNGTDFDGGWTFTFASPAGTGLATIVPLAKKTIVSGDCDVASGEPSIRDFRIDSPLALSIAADGGCVLGATVSVRLLGVGNSDSPLAGLDPAWLIDGRTADGGALTCVVDADTGAYGVPVDGGLRDAG